MRPLPGVWHPVNIQQIAALRVLLLITDIPIKRSGKLRVSECLGFPPREKHIFPPQGTSFAFQIQQVVYTCRDPSSIKTQICSLRARNTSLALSPETLAFLPWHVSLYPDLHEPEVAEQCLVNMYKGGSWGSLNQCLRPQEINAANAAIWSAVSLDSVARGPTVYFPPESFFEPPAFTATHTCCPQVAASVTAGLPGAVTLEGEQEEGGLGAVSLQPADMEM